MKNLTNVLKTMETETQGVKNDVINFLLEDVENYSPQDKLQDLLLNGCGSGMVNHLIYYTDTVAYFEEHESEIMEMLESFGIKDVETDEGIEQLGNIFPSLDTLDYRFDDLQTRTDKEIEENYTIEGLEEMTEDERDEIETEILTGLNPYELNKIDKNYLAWAIFEHNANVLFDELDEMELIK